MENFKTLVANELAKGRNIIFVPKYDSDLAEDFIGYLWANHMATHSAKGEYFHLDVLLPMEDRIKEMTPEQLADGFLTDEDLMNGEFKAPKQYKGWVLDFDYHTDAVYYYDPKSSISLYCSPSFEDSWGKSIYQLSCADYCFEGGEEYKVLFEVDFKDKFGDKKAQFDLWFVKVMQVIDNIELLAKNYAEICTKYQIHEAIYSFISNDEHYSALLHKRDALNKMNDLKDQLIEIVLDIKRK